MPKIFRSLFDRFEKGKYRGEILDNVVDENPEYVAWMIEQKYIVLTPELEDRLRKKL